MSFNTTWDGSYETDPAGSVAANTLDTVIQGLKVDIRQRVDAEHHMDLSSGAEDGVHKFPDYNLANRDAIGTPKEGQLIRRNDARSIDIYDGSDWIEFQAHSTGDYKMAAYDDTADKGWVKADGTSYLRTGIYEDLFNLIGVEYGNADATHFNVPALGGRIPIGIDPGGDADWDALGDDMVGGEKEHTLLEAELPDHVHDEGSLETDDPGDHGHNAEYTTKQTGTLGAIFRLRNPEDTPVFTSSIVQDAGAHTHAITGDTGTGSGSGDAMNNMPPFIAVQWYIKL
jgi:microcystin-dependent protein